MVMCMVVEFEVRLLEGEGRGGGIWGGIGGWKRKGWEGDMGKWEKWDDGHGRKGRIGWDGMGWDLLGGDGKIV